MAAPLVAGVTRNFFVRKAFIIQCKRTPLIHRIKASYQFKLSRSIKRSICNGQFANGGFCCNRAIIEDNIKCDSCQKCQQTRGYHSNLHRKTRKLVLGIETSCDDTGSAIVDDGGNVIGDALNSQTRTHVEMGGIIPPVARDLHQKHIKDVVQTSFQHAGLTLEDIDAIAVTVKPGLALSLNVGVNHAKDLAIHSGKPLIPIHHMEAHALTVRLLEKVAFPYLVLLISGGHCLLAVVRGVEDFMLIGKGIDEAPGDVLEKIARDLKLKNQPECAGLSGGRAIELMAEPGDPNAYPNVHMKKQNCNFSFSGIKTEYKKHIKTAEEKLGIHGAQVLPNVSDICASFQYNILHHLAKRVQRALEYCILKEHLPSDKRTLVLSGGVASNLFIREGLKKVCWQYDCQLVCPPPKLCTDNGIMIAWNGMEKLKLGIGVEPNPASVKIQARCPLGEDISHQVAECAIKLKSIKLI